MALMQALQDKFTGASLNPDKWTFDFVAATSVVSGGTFKMTLTPSNAASYGQALGGPNYAVSNYDMTSSYAYVQVLQVSAGVNPVTILKVTAGSGNFLRMQYLNGNLAAIQTVASSDTTLNSVAYNATTMAWWKIRELAGTTYWEYSSDGYSWTVLASAVNPITVTTLQAQLQCLENTSDASATAAIFANFNALPTGKNTQPTRPRSFAPGLAR